MDHEQLEQNVSYTPWHRALGVHASSACVICHDTSQHIFFFLLSPFGTVVINRRTLHTSYLPSADTFFYGFKWYWILRVQTTRRYRVEWSRESVRNSFWFLWVTDIMYKGAWHTRHTWICVRTTKCEKERKGFPFFLHLVSYYYVGRPSPASICNKHAKTTA